MKLTFRWYGEKDEIPLGYIKQIPNISGVVTAVYGTPVGEVWETEKIQKLKSLSLYYNATSMNERNSLYVFC